MLVKVRRKSFVDKKDKNRVVEYNEFYISFEFCVDGENTEVIDLPLKIEDKLAKSMLFENIATADFVINTNKGKDEKVYYNPAVTFYVGKAQYKVDVKMTPEAVVLARIGLAGVDDTSNLGF